MHWKTIMKTSTSVKHHTNGGSIHHAHGNVGTLIHNLLSMAKNLYFEVQFCVIQNNGLANPPFFFIVYKTIKASSQDNKGSLIC